MEHVTFLIDSNVSITKLLTRPVFRSILSLRTFERNPGAAALSYPSLGCRFGFRVTGWSSQPRGSPKGQAAPPFLPPFFAGIFRTALDKAHPAKANPAKANPAPARLSFGRCSRGVPVSGYSGIRPIAMLLDRRAARPAGCTAPACPPVWPPACPPAWPPAAGCAAGSSASSGPFRRCNCGRPAPEKPPENPPQIRRKSAANPLPARSQSIAKTGRVRRFQRISQRLWRVRAAGRLATPAASVRSTS